MADTERTARDAKAQMFDQLGKVKAGMLVVDDSGQHPQPMAPHVDRDAGVIWFITARSTDLAQAAGHGAKAGGGRIGSFTFIGKNDDYYASMRGPLDQVDDEAMIDELWTAQAAAWFEKGREDHEVTLLRFTLQDAEIWSNTRNPVVFAFEMARAVGTRAVPDVGEHVKVRWRDAA